jgi:SNF2 family DNA or RNA helicase
MMEAARIGMRMKPMQHQARYREASRLREYFGVFADMGTGKSKMATDEFCELYVQGQVDALVIIAPKSVYLNWTRRDDERPGELQKHLWWELLETTSVYPWSSKKRNKDEPILQQMLLPRPAPVVLAMNVEALSSVEDARIYLKKFLRAHRCFVLLDEATFMGAHDSRRTKYLLSIRDLCSFRRVLTGRPSAGSPLHVWGPMEFLKAGILRERNWFSFRAGYCEMKDTYVGPGRTVKTVTGFKNLDRLSRLIAPHSFFCKIEDCIDMPEKTYQLRTVEATPEQRRAYQEMKSRAFVRVAEGTASAKIALTEMLKCHQILCGHLRTDDGRVARLANNRLSVLDEIIDETDRQMIVWATYTADITSIVQHLKKSYGADQVAEYWGDTSVAEREKGEKEFQQGKRRFIVSNEATGGRGREWTAGKVMVFYSTTSDLELREQAERRSWRNGQYDPVQIIDMICEEFPLERKILTSHKNKTSVVNQIEAEGLRNWL